MHTSSEFRRHRPSGSRPLRLAAVLVVTGALGTVFACADSSDSFVTVGAGETGQDAALPPSFVPSDAGADSAPLDGALSDSVVTAPMCVSTECPAPFATCAGFGGELPTYACSTNLSNDIWNCGACNHQCGGDTPAYHLQMGCADGECQAFCKKGYSDCNGITDDGCESDPLSDSNNCGVCGNKCAAGVACIEGTCGCPPGLTNCNGTCVDLATDDGNCGACGTACFDNQPDGGEPVPAHMYYGCRNRQCTDLRCVHTQSEFWEDCNHDVPTDGCEINLASPSTDNCGKCGNRCDPGQKCFDTEKTGVACQCQGGQTLCPAIPPYFPEHCADVENDPQNCGSCGYGCPYVTGAVATCSHGVCGYVCTGGTADCNNRADDGCETDLNRDPANCGACGAACAVAEGQPCVAGRCATRECDAGGQPQ